MFLVIILELFLIASSLVSILFLKKYDTSKSNKRFQYYQQKQEYTIWHETKQWMMYQILYLHHITFSSIQSNAIIDRSALDTK